MTTEEIRAVIDAMVEAWNERDLDGYLSHLTDDAVWHDPVMVEPAEGREAVRAFSEAVLRAFPDFRYTIRPPVCVADDGVRCAVPWKIEGTHSAPLEPPGYEPTGRKAAFEGIDLLGFRGERVCRIDTYFDVLVPAEQLLGLTLRPRPGSWRERFVVSVQRIRAAWLRRLGRTATLCGAFLLFVASTPCYAQSSSSVAFALGAGPSVPVGDLGDQSTNVGVQATGMVIFGDPRRSLRFRVDAMYSHFWGSSDGTNPDTDIVAFTGGIVLSVKPSSNVSPYFVTGLGLSLSSDDCPSTTSLGANGGFGVRVHRFFIEGTFRLAASGCNSMYQIPISLGIRL
jgi:uncharacterized protein (TIGR02246 family)